MLIQAKTANQQPSTGFIELAAALLTPPPKSAEEIKQEEEQKKQAEEQARKQKEQEKKEQETLQQQQQQQSQEAPVTSPLDTTLSPNEESRKVRSEESAVDDYKTEDKTYFETNRAQTEQLIEKLIEPLQERIFEGALLQAANSGKLDSIATDNSKAPFTNQNELINEAKLNELGILLDRFEVKTNLKLKRKIEDLYTRIEDLLRQSRAEDQAFVAYDQADDIWTDASFPERASNSPYALAA